jgi:hypothetical protein
MAQLEFGTKDEAARARAVAEAMQQKQMRQELAQRERQGYGCFLTGAGSLVWLYGWGMALRESEFDVFTVCALVHAAILLGHGLPRLLTRIP